MLVFHACRLHSFVFFVLLYRIGNFCARVDEGICAEGIDSSRKKCRRSGDTLRFLCPPVRLWMSNFVNSLTLKQNKITHRWHSRPLGSLAESPDRLPFFLWIGIPSAQFSLIHLNLKVSMRACDITAEMTIIKHEELEKADRDLSPVTWCSFRNFFVLAITALHCLSASARVCKSSYQ